MNEKLGKEAKRQPKKQKDNTKKTKQARVPYALFRKFKVDFLLFVANFSFQRARQYKCNDCMSRSTSTSAPLSYAINHFVSEILFHLAFSSVGYRFSCSL